MNASKFSSTDSTSINQLKNVSVTGLPQDHRLKKTYSMNSLVGSNQHESTSSRLYIILYFRCGEMYPLLRNILDVIHVVLLIFK